MAVAVAGVLPLASPPAAAAVVESAVVINEIHYNPPGDDHEFLELHNPTVTDVDLTGACFTKGISGCFDPGVVLPAGGFVVVAEDLAAFAVEFPTAPAPVLQHGGSLSNGGERVTLSLGPDVLDTVEYDDGAPWPATPDGQGPSLELADPTADNDHPSVWWPSDPGPTPGAINSRFGQAQLPAITDLTVGAVAVSAPVAVSAMVTGAATVDMEVTVGVGDPVLVPMVDDGTHGDGAAGDLRYGASIAAQPAGTLVRYRVLATSAAGTGSLPAEGAARPRLGYVVDPPPADPPMSGAGVPVIDWHISPVDLQTLMDNKLTNDYVPVVVSYGTEVWDGARVRVQGNNRSGPKLSYKFKMPKGHPLVAPGILTDPVDEFVFDSDLRDTLGITPLLSFDVYADGNPYLPQRAKVRVQQNGSYFGLYTFLEEWEDAWMERVGLDGPGDEVFEPEDIVGTFQDEGDPALLVPRFDEVSADSYDRLYELVQAIDAPPTPQRSAELRDLFDLPALVDFLAVGSVVQHWDSTVHNYVLVREGDTGRWRFVPTDLDFTLGQPILNPPNPANGFRLASIFPYGPDSLVSALRTDPVFSEMYARRVRTLTDRWLERGELQAAADTQAEAIGPEVQLDRARWGLPLTHQQGRSQLSNYIADRIARFRGRNGPGEIPLSGPPNSIVEITEVRYSGDPAHDFVELHNRRSEATDLSGWTISGAADAVLPPGTVIAGNGYLVVPADPQASQGDRPSGTAVAGRIASGIDDTGGTLQLTRDSGKAETTVTFATTSPWPAAAGTGAATLERIEPLGPRDQPASWRASPTATGSPGTSGFTPLPTTYALEVEAALDQAEVAPTVFGGIGITVSVTNVGTSYRPSVGLDAPGTDCSRPLGTLAPGANVTFRCSTVGGVHTDRAYAFTAASGPARHTAVGQVRTLRHATQYFEKDMMSAPTLQSVTLGAAGSVNMTWTNPPATASPLRWTIATGIEPGRAVPTAGHKAPAAVTSASIGGLTEGTPLRWSVASRNNTGTGPRSILTPWITPRSSADWPFTSSEELVAQTFRDLDGREATAPEMADWSTRFAQGSATPATLIVDRLSGPDWRDVREPVARLYIGLFDRLPSQGGLQAWSNRHRDGTPLASVAQSFVKSREFRSRYGTLDDSAYVNLLYRKVLGRSPSPVLARRWTSRLAAGWTRGEVALEFIQSTEGRTNLAPRTQVSMVWTGLLGVTPSSTDAAPALTWLDAGGSIEQVIEGLRSSDAYATRVDP